MSQLLLRGFIGGFLASAALACGAQKEDAKAPSESEEPPANPAPAPSPAEPALISVDAAAPQAPLAAGEHLLDLDGDGKQETLLVTPSHVEFGELSVAHTLHSKLGSPTQPKTFVIDVDTSDSRQELLIRLTSYEALAYNVLVYMRDGKLKVSEVIYTRDLEATGDGKLKAHDWTDGKRSEVFYEIKGDKVLLIKSKKSRGKKKRK